MKNVLITIKAPPQSPVSLKKIKTDIYDSSAQTEVRLSPTEEGGTVLDPA